MRPLTEDENRAVFDKLAKFLGVHLKLLLSRTDIPHVLRLHRERVYYVSELVLRKASNIARERLASLGTCVGKFTHARKFHLAVTALDVLAPYAVGKVWLKPSAEMSFLYGNHVLKAGVGKVTEGMAGGDGVVVHTMGGLPLGFGLTARPGSEWRKAAPTDIVVLNQADVGGYLRDEASSPASAL